MFLQLEVLKLCPLVDSLASCSSLRPVMVRAERGCINILRAKARQHFLFHTKWLWQGSPGHFMVKSLNLRTSLRCNMSVFVAQCPAYLLTRCFQERVKGACLRGFYIRNQYLKRKRRPHVKCQSFWNTEVDDRAHRYVCNRVRVILTRWFLFSALPDTQNMGN